MAGMAIGCAGADVSAGVQAFTATTGDDHQSATTDGAAQGASALSIDTAFDSGPAAEITAGNPAAAAAGAAPDRLAELLSAARDQMRADGLDRNPLAQFRLQAAGDDSPFGQQLQAFLDKIDRFAGTIDASESQAIAQLLETAKQDGGFTPSSLARLMIQIEGSAAGLPPDYLAAADSAQQFAARMEADLSSIAAQVNEQIAAGGFTNETMHLLEQLQSYADGVQLLQERLRANFELALQDPTLALERLQTGMQQAGSPAVGVSASVGAAPVAAASSSAA